MAEPYRYMDATTPGRRDVNGVEWWACDPYPTWFRWDDNGDLRTDPAEWLPDDPLMAVREAEKLEARADRLDAEAATLREQAKRCRTIS